MKFADCSSDSWVPASSHAIPLPMTSTRRLQSRRYVQDLVVVEVEAGHGVVGAGPLGLLLDREDRAVPVELDDPVALGVPDVVAEDRGPLLPGRRPLQ